MRGVASTDISPHAAKKIVRAFLEEHRLPFEKLTARTIDFTDLARAKCVFVTVHGWTPNPIAEDLTHLAVNNGFRVDFRGEGFVC